MLEGGSGTARIPQEILVADLHQTGCPEDLDRRRRQPDPAISVQVLLKRRFDRLQRSVRASHDRRRIADVVSSAVEIPNEILVRATVLPGHLIPARRLLSPKRLPCPELPVDSRCALELDVRSGTTGVTQEEPIADLDKAGCPEALDGDGRGYQGVHQDSSVGETELFNVGEGVRFRGLHYTNEIEIPDDLITGT